MMLPFLQPLALLGQLKYGKVLSALAEINGFSAEERKDKSLEMKLNRIIVIGDESAGKSSTLERIAMAAVLPRNTGICTRMPIVLQLRHDPSIEGSAEIFLTLPGTDRIRVEGGEEEARGMIEQKMEEIKAQGIGIISDQEVVVEVHSNGVPTLDLVDLPGLIAARNDGTEPENIAEQTIECTRRFLTHADTGAVVCVIPAGIDNLRMARALQLLQETPELLKFSIGVFAKTDKAMDHDWEETIEATGPLYKLEQRLRGTSEDLIPLRPHGYVAVKNRNTRSRNAQSLTDSYKDEADWFTNKSGIDRAFLESAAFFNADCEPSDSCVLGIPTLIKRIDKLFCQQLVDGWVPKELERNQAEVVRIHRALADLGCDPVLLTVETLSNEANHLVQSACNVVQLDEICVQLCEKPPEAIDAPAHLKNPTPTVTEWVVQKQELRAHWENQLDDVHVFFVKRVVDRITCAFDQSDQQLRVRVEPDIVQYYAEKKGLANVQKITVDDKKVEMVGFYLHKQRESNPLLRLPRFEKLTQKCLSNVRDMMECKKSKFRMKAASGIDFYFNMKRSLSSRPSGADISTDLLRVVAECVIETLALPLVNSKSDGLESFNTWSCELLAPSAEEAADQSLLRETENSAARRAALQRELITLARVKEALRSNLDIDISHM